MDDACDVLEDGSDSDEIDGPLRPHTIYLELADERDVGTSLRGFVIYRMLDVSCKCQAAQYGDDMRVGVGVEEYDGSVDVGDMDGVDEGPRAPPIVAYASPIALVYPGVVGDPIRVVQYRS